MAPLDGGVVVDVCAQVPLLVLQLPRLRAACCITVWYTLSLLAYHYYQ